jgi:predicted PurR-regulated permease PerM
MVNAFTFAMPPKNTSYWFMAAALVLAVWLHLGGPVVAALFTFLALDRLHFFKHRGKWLSVAVFLLLIFGFSYGVGFVITQAVRALPEIADKAIPTFIQLARQYHVELPFTDYDSLKDAAMDTVKSGTAYFASVARVARGATSGVLLLLLGVVISIGLFLNPSFERAGDKTPACANYYAATCSALSDRFRNLYTSFKTVMGAQVIISAINTVLTAIFVLVTQLPYAVVVIGLTFLCGLLPIIGNIISNSIIVGIAVTVSPKEALVAFIFLIVVHKLEYFLNSKIVGDRIRNPFWLTLLAVVLGERIMGIPGMILAPVILNYVKIEASAPPANSTQSL